MTTRTLAPPDHYIKIKEGTPLSEKAICAVKALVFIEDTEKDYTEAIVKDIKGNKFLARCRDTYREPWELIRQLPTKRDLATIHAIVLQNTKTPILSEEKRNYLNSLSLKELRDAYTKVRAQISPVENGFPMGYPINESQAYCLKMAELIAEREYIRDRICDLEEQVIPPIPFN